MANDICPSFLKLFSVFYLFQKKWKTKEDQEFNRLFIIFSNVLQTMTGIFKFCKNCASSIKKCWRMTLQHSFRSPCEKLVKWVAWKENMLNISGIILPIFFKLSCDLLYVVGGQGFDRLLCNLFSSKLAF